MSVHKTWHIYYWVLLLTFSAGAGLAAEDPWAAAVTVDYSAVPLAGVLKDLQGKTGITLTYTQPLLESAKPITFQENGAPAAEVLHRILAPQGLEYTRTGPQTGALVAGATNLGMTKTAGRALRTLVRLEAKLETASLAGDEVRIPSWTSADDAALQEAATALAAAGIYFHTRGNWDNLADTIPFSSPGAAPGTGDTRITPYDADLRAGMLMPLLVNPPVWSQQVAGRSVFKTARRLCDDPDSLTRACGICALCLATAKTAWNDPSLFQEALDGAFKDASPEVRFAACAVCYVRRDLCDAPAMERAACDPSAAVRLLACLTRFNLAAHDIELLIPLLKDPNPLARSAAFALLALDKQPPENYAALLDASGCAADPWLKINALAFEAARQQGREFTAKLPPAPFTSAAAAPSHQMALSGALVCQYLLLPHMAAQPRNRSPLNLAPLLSWTQAGPIFLRMLGSLAHVFVFPEDAQRRATLAWESPDPAVRLAALRGANPFPQLMPQRVKQEVLNAWPQPEFADFGWAGALIGRNFAGDEGLNLLQIELGRQCPASRLRPLLAQISLNSEFRLADSQATALCDQLLAAKRADLQILFMRGPLRRLGTQATQYARIAKEGEPDAALVALIDDAVSWKDQAGWFETAQARLAALNAGPDVRTRCAAVACADWLVVRQLRVPGQKLDEKSQAALENWVYRTLDDALSGKDAEFEAAQVMLNHMLEGQWLSRSVDKQGKRVLHPQVIAGCLKTLNKVLDPGRGPDATETLARLLSRAPAVAMPENLSAAIAQAARRVCETGTPAQQLTLLRVLPSGNENVAPLCLQLCTDLAAGKVPSASRARAIVEVGRRPELVSARLIDYLFARLADEAEAPAVRRQALSALADQGPYAARVVAAVRALSDAGAFHLQAAELNKLGKLPQQFKAIAQDQVDPPWLKDLAQVGLKAYQNAAQAGVDRRAALELYAGTAGKEAAGELTRAILDANAETALRTVAANWLAQADPQSGAFATLRPGAAALNAELRKSLVLAAAHMPQAPEAAAFVLSFWNDANAGTPRARSEVLANLKAPAPPEVRQAVETLALDRNAEPDLRLQAARWLLSNDAGTKLLEKILPDYGSLRVELRQGLALAAATALKAAAAPEFMAAALRDNDLRKRHADLLKQISLPASAPLAAVSGELIRDESAPLEIRTAAAGWLSRAAPDTDVYAQMLSVFAKQPLELRLALGAAAAKKLPAPKAVELVMAALRDKALGRDRNDILYNLQPPGTPQLRALLLELDNQPKLQEAARAALQRLTESLPVTKPPKSVPEEF